MCYLRSYTDFWQQSPVSAIRWSFTFCSTKFPFVMKSDKLLTADWSLINKYTRSAISCVHYTITSHSQIRSLHSLISPNWQWKCSLVGVVYHNSSSQTVNNQIADNLKYSSACEILVSFENAKPVQLQRPIDGFPDPFSSKDGSHTSVLMALIVCLSIWAWALACFTWKK